MVTTKVQFGFANTYSSFIFYAKCKEYSAFQMSEFRSEHEGCSGGGSRRQKTLDSFLQSHSASKDAKKSVFECPICGGAVEASSELAFNAHLDRCLKERSEKSNELVNSEPCNRDKSGQVEQLGGKSSPFPKNSNHHVLCPVCQERIAAGSDDDVLVNRHVDECLSRQMLKSEKRAADGDIGRDRDKPPPSKRAKSSGGVRGIESYLTKGLGSR